jgi:hypothetical protein
MVDFQPRSIARRCAGSLSRARRCGALLVRGADCLQQLIGLRAARERTTDACAGWRKFLRTARHP